MFRALHRGAERFRPAVEIDAAVRWVLQKAYEWARPLCIYSFDVTAAFDVLHPEDVAATLGDLGAPQNLTFVRLCERRRLRGYTKGASVMTMVG